MAEEIDAQPVAEQQLRERTPVVDTAVQLEDGRMDARLAGAFHVDLVVVEKQHPVRRSTNGIEDALEVGAARLNVSQVAGIELPVEVRPVPERDMYAALWRCWLLVR